MDVLVIDDDRDSRSRLVKVLEQAGFAVRAAENGLQALAALQDHAVRAIVCDIRMAFLDGRHFYDELEFLDSDLAARVLFVTGYGDAPDIHAFLERTGQPALTKPYEVDALVRHVRALMQRPRQRQSLPSLATSVARARRLPELFRSLEGSAVGRVQTLVFRYWSGLSDHAQRELAEVLLPVLEPLTEAQAAVSDAIRDECAEAVATWFGRHEPNGQPRSAETDESHT